MATRERVGGEEAVRTLGREAAALCLGVGGLLVGLAVVSYQPASRANMAGPLGAALADVLVQSLGVASVLVPIALVAYAAALFAGSPPRLGSPRLGCALGALLACATLAQLAVGSWRGMEAGGVIGGFLSVVLGDGFGDAGAWVIAASLFVLLASFASGKSLVGLAAASGRATGRGALVAGTKLRERVASMRSRDHGEPILLREVVGGDNGRHANVRHERERREPPVVVTPSSTPPAKPSRERASRRQVELPFTAGKSYCLPDSSVLDPPVEIETGLDRETLITNSRVLEAKLQTFDVRGEVRGIHPGPVITTYEFEPAPGIKVQRVVSLADDLAMAMRAMSVRILAPIPGKSVVGIEVSNAQRETVSLREVVSSDAFQQSTSSLVLALGKDTTGRPVVGDLARMPHLLVAGATGAGKSVFLNSLLMSILMRASPQDVRMVLVDPKMLELSTYEEIPHLLVPVITEGKSAVTVLENLVTEMDDRYRFLREKGVRSIDAYNRLLASEGAPSVIELRDSEGEEEDGEEEEEEGEEEEQEQEVVHQHMPRIVVIIDELADLMMTRRDCEEPITRLAQKARAAGIHLVVATQRPSVDVITGLIKANFPARISFQVAGKVDSRTILDSMGAERLLGEGDMLFLPPGTSRLQRLHGAYVSDAEIKRVTDFVRAQEKPQYRMELFEDEEAEDERSLEPGEEPMDEMYDAAVRVVTESGKASISYVQRRLQVGYNRAARMIECMEREGVVSGADHRGVREVIARSHGD